MPLPPALLLKTFSSQSWTEQDDVGQAHVTALLCLKPVSFQPYQSLVALTTPSLLPLLEKVLMPDLLPRKTKHHMPQEVQELSVLPPPSPHLGVAPTAENPGKHL